MKKLTAEDIAKIAYESTVALAVMQGDYSKQAWNELPENAKQSNIDHAQFLIDNPHSTPEAAHNAWLEKRKELGWKWGEETDAEKKTDAGMVEYSQRSAYHNGKAYLFRRTVEILGKFKA